jgi:hypothetical protein
MSLSLGRIRRCAVLSLMVLGVACSILGGTRSAWAQLSLTDLYYAMPAADSNSLTPTIKVSWSAPPANVTYQGMKRDTGPSTAVTVITTTPSNQMSGFYIDTNWVSGTSYRYYLYGTAHVEVLDANGNHYVPPQYIDQPWQSNLVTITPYSLPVSEDATADSRIDPRYSVTTYVNFPFNDSNTANNLPCGCTGADCTPGTTPMAARWEGRICGSPCPRRARLKSCIRWAGFMSSAPDWPRPAAPVSPSSAVPPPPAGRAWG